MQNQLMGFSSQKASISGPLKRRFQMLLHLLLAFALSAAFLWFFRSSPVTQDTMQSISPDVSAVPEPFRHGEVWLDTEGRPILAHGGCVIWDAPSGKWFWYGEQRHGETFEGILHPEWNMTFAHAETLGVGCYSSPDLRQWTFEGIALRSSDDASHPLYKRGVINRPKVLRSPTTGKYVMWFHNDLSNYALALAAVAVADHPQGPFTFLDNQRAKPHESRDFTLFQDEDGSAYHVFNSDNNRTLRIARLSPDYLHHDGTFGEAHAGESREAPVMFKHGGTYYLITSGCTGWDPNAATYAVAEHPLGPWTSMHENPCVGEGAETTFRSQGAHVIPMPGTPGAFIFIANRWNPKNIIDSRHVWLPLTLRDGKPRIEWKEAWTLGDTAR
jgi:hypothetical protein